MRKTVTYVDVTILKPIHLLRRKLTFFSSIQSQGILQNYHFLKLKIKFWPTAPTSHLLLPNFSADCENMIILFGTRHFILSAYGRFHTKNFCDYICSCIFKSYAIVFQQTAGNICANVGTPFKWRHELVFATYTIFSSSCHVNKK